MKNHKFTLTVTFSDNNLSAKDIEMITDNITMGIQQWVNSAGIVPEDAEYFTKSIQLKHKLTGYVDSYNIVQQFNFTP